MCFGMGLEEILVVFFRWRLIMNDSGFTGVIDFMTAAAGSAASLRLTTTCRNSAFSSNSLIFPGRTGTDHRIPTRFLADTSKAENFYFQFYIKVLYQPAWMLTQRKQAVLF